MLSVPSPTSAFNKFKWWRNCKTKKGLLATNCSKLQNVFQGCHPPTTSYFSDILNKISIHILSILQVVWSLCRNLGLNRCNNIFTDNLAFPDGLRRSRNCEYCRSTTWIPRVSKPFCMFINSRGWTWVWHSKYALQYRLWQVHRRLSIL